MAPSRTGSEPAGTSGVSSLIVYIFRFRYISVRAYSGLDCPLDVQEPNVLGVLLNEVSARFNVLAHQNREDLVRRQGIVHRHLQQGPVVRVHGGVPQFRVVHFTEALVALDAVVLGDAAAGGLAREQLRVAFTVAVDVVVRGIGPLDPVQRRLREVDVAVFDQRAHVAEQQRHQQRRDVLAVDVGIGHEHDLVVAQLGDVEVLANAGAEGGDHGLDLGIAERLVQPGTLDVQDLAAQRQDGLGLRVAAALGGTAGRVTLHDVDLAPLRVLRGAVGQLAGHAEGFQRALAAGVVPGLPGGHARLGCGDRLADDVPGGTGVALEPVAQAVGDNALDKALDLGVAELGLGLALELRFGELHGNDCRQALADVVPGEVVFLFLDDVLLPRIAVDE